MTAVKLGALALIATLGLSAVAHAQALGSIAGVARDNTGAVLPGVTVEAASPALIEKVRTTVTDGSGAFRIIDLRPGTYSVTFSLAGFATFRRDALDLTAGFNATVNADMRIGDLQETVTVSGASPVVDIQNVRTQTVLKQEVLQALPTSKSFQAMAALTLGATQGIGVQDVGGSQGENFAQFAVHGNRGNDVRLQYDGLQAHGIAGGGGGRQLYANSFAFEETVLETAGISAEAETGGVQMNMVPRDGGNSFKIRFEGSGTSERFQGTNISTELRARGVTTPPDIRKIWDIGGGVGGPIKKDRIWFHYAARYQGAETNAPGNFFNKTPHSFVYTPDLNRPAYTRFHNKDPRSVRLTWQVTEKNKFSFFNTWQSNCICYYETDGSGGLVYSPDASIDHNFSPTNFTLGTWSYPVTSRLLFSAGASYYTGCQCDEPTDESSYKDIAMRELSTGFLYNARANGVATQNDYGRYTSKVANQRVSLTYVTGSHSLKAGVASLEAQQDRVARLETPFRYDVRFGVPAALTYYIMPQSLRVRLMPSLGVFGQDQWTIRRVTLNLGMRYDYLRSYVPATTVEAGQFVGRREFPKVDNVPNWKDVSPRAGAAVDVFGTGKTAIKGTIGRYPLGATVDVAAAVAPAAAIATSTSRTWADANANFVPDCDLKVPDANGECGAMSNRLFGTPVAQTRWSSDALLGSGVRPYQWQTSLVLQHELRAGVAVNAGYFRTWYGNFTVLDNKLVSSADFNPYCVTAPTDSRLSTSGQQLCGLYDVNPSRFGQVSNEVTRVKNFGERTEVFDGIDIGTSARFGRGGLVNGGVSVGRTAIDNCVTVDSPQASRAGFCDTVLPWMRQLQVKLAVVYPLPVWDIQMSTIYQGLPGFPNTATLVYTNAQIAPSLGRNLAAGAAGTASVDIIQPNTLFEKRLNQFDLRFSKRLRVGKLSLTGKLDAYNLFNANTVLRTRGAYGPTWLQPVSVLSARMFKFGIQADF